MRPRIYARTALVMFCAASLFGQQTSQPPPAPGQTAKPPTQLPATMSATPLTVRDKFDYRVVQTLGLRGSGGALISAAIGQARNSPYEWSQGAEGFAKRYVSGFAGNLSRQTFAFVLESAFHEDPRYFPSEEKGAKARTWNALKQVFICKTDRESTEFAWARVMSNFAAGQFVNLWQPSSTGSVADGFTRSFIGFGGDAAYNLMQEFIPFTRPRSLRHGHLEKQP